MTKDEAKQVFQEHKAFLDAVQNVAQSDRQQAIEAYKAAKTDDERKAVIEKQHAKLVAFLQNFKPLPLVVPKFEWKSIGPIAPPPTAAPAPLK